ncbi:hypothetical protein L249_8606 [Ophiocordyceps polyrhachis-furcata BCC 54312]|uniref:Presequence translocated-associated motor subunit PAM17 n=1 Tax=Ophiocordyceps polyrhachis-furcata BCC 54312 TaxID=1330021 RepID=A0A367L6T1_9HYPO|nr:hypothetical protein L249_8606 [Ophiocordyceps polyrhachis-furcata BCC 54312]
MASALRTVASRQHAPSCFAPCRRLRHGRLSLPIEPLRRLVSSVSPQTTTASKPTVSFTPYPKPALDWNSFFLLRLRRRRVQVTFSLAGFVACGVGGAYIISTGIAEPLVAQIPLDPIFTLGLIGAACAGLGWLAGPSIGNQVFYLLNYPFKSQMIRKESEFFTRIKRNRVDPSNSSAGNPVPDFYGERIQSVAGYRQWLKDQRAFNRKKTANFV